MPQLADVAKVKEAWALLVDLYAVVPFLMELSDDRRRAHAAGLAIASWNACRRKPGLESMAKPIFVSSLEERMSQLGDGAGATQEVLNAPNVVEPVEPDFWQGQGDFGEPFNFNFADIDWSFWDSIS